MRLPDETRCSGLPAPEEVCTYYDGWCSLVSSVGQSNTTLGRVGFWGWCREEGHVVARFGPSAACPWWSLVPMESRLNLHRLSNCHPPTTAEAPGKAALGKRDTARRCDASPHEPCPGGSRTGLFWQCLCRPGLFFFTQGKAPCIDAGASQTAMPREWAILTS